MAPATLSALLLLAAQPSAMGPPPPITRPAPERECRDRRGSEEGEIVVCGQTYDENSPYRIPREFRGRGLTEDRHISWDTRTRDQEALERFSNQNSGPSGIYRHSRQVDCEWRVARQQLRGERPDCGKGIGF